MQSPYELANAEIAEIRRKNAEKLSRREAEVRARAPELAEEESRLSAGALSIVKSVLDGGAELSRITEYVNNARAKKAAILARLGLPSDYLNEIYTCEKCRDTGFDKNGRRCECLKKMIAKHIGANANLTEVMKGQTFESFDLSLFVNQPDVKGRQVVKIMQHICERAKEFADSFEQTRENLYMYGAAGTGKTFVSSCIANRALSRGKSVYYCSAFRLLDMLEKLKFGRYEGDEAANAEYVAKYVYDVDLLILDDVGTEFVSGYSTAALFDILNSRLSSGKSTVISSNLSPSKVDELYGTRIASRIAGEYTLLSFVGCDLRRLRNR